MAGDINRVTLVGRLTRDPELRHLPSGSPVLQLGLAVNGRPVERGRQPDNHERHPLNGFGRRVRQGEAVADPGRPQRLPA